MAMNSTRDGQKADGITDSGTYNSFDLALAAPIVRIGSELYTDVSIAGSFHRAFAPIHLTLLYVQCSRPSPSGALWCFRSSNPMGTSFRMETGGTVRLGRTIATSVAIQTK